CIFQGKNHREKKCRFSMLQGDIAAIGVGSGESAITKEFSKMCTHKNDRSVQKRIAIVGVGSGGSALTDMLWKKDADKMYGEFSLTLVDPDRFENSNVTRHILRSGSLGKFKAEE